MELVFPHYGIKEVEEALENPDEGTQHFPAVNIINVGTMTNSVIQQSSPSGAQNINFGAEEKADLKSFLLELKQSLDQLNLASDEQNEIIADINTAEVQVDSPKPKTNILRESLKSIRAILEGAAANATPELIEKASMFIAMLGSG